MIIKEILQKTKTCKHSQVFKPIDAPVIVTAAYIKNETLDALGNPEKVKITIESIGT